MNKNINIHKSSYIDEGVTVGEGTKIWHFSHVMSGARMGKNCNLGQNVFIGNEVIIGNNVKIQNNVSVYNGVIIEDDVFIGPSVVFTNVINPRAFINRNKEFKKTLIKKGVSIGANSTIVCGNEIGKYAFVGAGSVITKNVLPYRLVYGCPAVEKGFVCKKGHKAFLKKEKQIYCNICRELIFI